MEQSKRIAYYDPDLHIEACYFRGIRQTFPNHVHDYYVLGLIEAGPRRMTCRGRTDELGPGDMILFHPGDSHSCIDVDGCAFSYRSFHLPKAVMEDLNERITGQRTLPGFSQNLIRNSTVAGQLRTLHRLILAESRAVERKNTLLQGLFSHLLEHYGQPTAPCTSPCRAELDAACRFLQTHYAQPIRLDEICRHAGLSKSTLLRAFTQEKGVTPYRYLETLRINQAKKLLAEGYSPAETAMLTGFYDQSQLTKFFTRFIGLSPGSYQALFLHQDTAQKGDHPRHGV